MAPYERLEAWRHCHELVLAVYEITRPFPSHERYGLTSQLRRAALSAATSIAEGAALRGPRQFRRFLDVSLGSLSEVSYLLRVARDLGYVSTETWQRLEALRDEAGKTTWGLYRSLTSRSGGGG